MQPRPGGSGEGHHGLKQPAGHPRWRFIRRWRERQDFHSATLTAAQAALNSGAGTVLTVAKLNRLTRSVHDATGLMLAAVTVSRQLWAEAGGIPRPWVNSPFREQRSMSRRTFDRREAALGPMARELLARGPPACRRADLRMKGRRERLARSPVSTSIAASIDPMQRKPSGRSGDRSRDLSDLRPRSAHRYYPLLDLHLLPPWGTRLQVPLVREQVALGPSPPSGSRGKRRPPPARHLRLSRGRLAAAALPVSCPQRRGRPRRRAPHIRVAEVQALTEAMPRASNSPDPGSGGRCAAGEVMGLRRHDRAGHARRWPPCATSKQPRTATAPSPRP